MEQVRTAAGDDWSGGQSPDGSGATLPTGVLSIAQFGSTRSINAGVAAGIAMHAWVRQHVDRR